LPVWVSIAIRIFIYVLPRQHRGSPASPPQQVSIEAMA